MEFYRDLGFGGQLKFITNHRDKFIGHGRCWTCQGEIIDLASEKDLDTFLDHLVDILLVGGAMSAESNEDGRNVRLPEAARFQVSLHCAEDGKYLIA